MLVVVAGVSVVAYWASHGRRSPALAQSAPLLPPVVVGERVSRLLDEGHGLALSSQTQRECALRALDRDAALVASLGDDPAASPHFTEVRTIVDRCREQADGDPVLEGHLRSDLRTAPTEAQSACVHRGVLAYSDDDRHAVERFGLRGLPEGVLRNQVLEMLSICGIDRRSLVSP
jgi:hypothetical protein